MTGGLLVIPTGGARGDGIGVRVREMVEMQVEMDMRKEVVLGRGKIPNLKG